MATREERKFCSDCRFKACEWASHGSPSRYVCTNHNTMTDIGDFRSILWARDICKGDHFEARPLVTPTFWQRFFGRVS